MLKEYGKIIDGELCQVIAAEECPEGMKRIIRDAIIPEDVKLVYVETETTIRQTYQETLDKENQV